MSFTNWISDDNGALTSFPKVFLYRTPVGADPTQYARDTDWNELGNALKNTRDWIRGAGAFYGMTEQASAPTPSSIGGALSVMLWAKTDHRLHAKINNVDKVIAFTDDAVTAYTTVSSGATTLAQERTLHFDGTVLQAVDNGAASRTDVVIANGSIGNALLANPSLTVSAGAGLTGGGLVALGSSVSLALPATGVTAGSYTNANITVDGYGRVTAAANGAGASTTLHAAYAAGAGASDSTINLDSTRGGVLIRDNATTPLGGTLFGVQDSAGTTRYVDIPDNGSLTFKSGVADGAGAWGYIFDTAATISTGKLIDIRNNNISKIQFDATGNIRFMASGGGIANSTGTRSVSIDYPIAGTASPYNCAWVPATDNSSVYTLGSSSYRWYATWSRQYAGITQAVSFSATPALDPTAGETIHFGAITGNVTGATLANGLSGQLCTIVVLKDATASTYTVTLTGTNVRTAGALTLSPPNAVATITLRWDNQLTSPAWVEIGRTTGL